MNRYVAAGIAQDARDGRRVIVVSRQGAATRAAFSEIAQHAADATRVSRANGRERIEFSSNGRVMFTTPMSAAHRGVPADIVYIDAVDLQHETLTNLTACLQASRSGELIRA